MVKNKFKSEMRNTRTKIRQCPCGGIVWEYPAGDYFPMLRKCDHCGDEDQGDINDVIK